MPRRPPRRVFLLVVAVTICIALVLLVRASIWPSENALVGQTEAAVRERYGQPKHEFAGHYGLPDYAWTQQFKGEVKSDVFQRLGGEVYVTFEKRNGQWVVICNSYLSRGSAF